MSLPPESHIFTGAWINWSRGLVLGSTITLSQRNGTLLTAFLGIFVTVAGAGCWRIMSFLIHQHRVKQGTADAIHHQQQAILRNSSTPTAAAWQLTQLAWHWRKSAAKSIVRSLPFIVLAICNILLSAVAGVFSGDVTKAAGNETLIHSPNCGYFVLDFKPSTDPIAYIISGPNSMDTNDTLAATAYSRACYGQEPSGSQCYQYPKPNIAFTNQTVDCPFGDDICKAPGGFQLDTGLIDSHTTLGINARPSDRVQYRRVTTCAVLQTQPYAKYFNSTGDGGEVQQLVHYSYETFSATSLQNYTFEYNTNNVVGHNGYTLLSSALFDGQSNSIPALNRSDADVALMFLAPNSVHYFEPVLDPWFQATILQNLTDPGRENTTEYIPDHWAGVLGCADQVQLHNPVNDRSTPLTSLSALATEAPKLAFNEIQGATVMILYDSANYQRMYYSIHSQGARALRANDLLSGTVLTSPGLPDNQWQIEATQLFSISMAKLQQMMVNFADGPAQEYEGMKFVKGNETLCTRQKIRGSNGFLSFSVLGVAIILILGGLLVFISLVLDSIIGLVRQKFNWNDHKRLQWAVDEKLQLQRLAFEGVGQGRWKGGVESIPTTLSSREELVGFGENPNRYHPIYARQEYFGNQTVGIAEGSPVSTPPATVEESKTAAFASRETGRLLS